MTTKQKNILLFQLNKRNVVNSSVTLLPASSSNSRGKWNSPEGSFSYSGTAVFIVYLLAGTQANSKIYSKKKVQMYLYSELYFKVEQLLHFTVLSGELC